MYGIGLSKKAMLADIAINWFGLCVKCSWWGLEYEFVTPDVAGALKLVTPVRKGLAPDRPPRKNVPDEVVKATLPHLLPTVADNTTFYQNLF